MAAPTRLSSPHPPRGAWEPRALQRVLPLSAALGRSDGRLPSICAEPLLGAPRALGMTPPRGPAGREGFPNAGSSPSSPAGDGEVGAGGAPRRSSRSRPPAGPRPLQPPLTPRQCLRVGRPAQDQARDYRRLPQSLGPLLPGEPPPSGFVRLFLPSPLQQQAERRAAGAPDPRPLPAEPQGSSPGSPRIAIPWVQRRAADHR